MAIVFSSVFPYYVPTVLLLIVYCKSLTILSISLVSVFASFPFILHTSRICLRLSFFVTPSFFVVLIISSRMSSYFIRLHVFPISSHDFDPFSTPSPTNMQRFPSSFRIDSFVFAIQFLLSFHYFSLFVLCILSSCSTSSCGLSLSPSHLMLSSSSISHVLLPSRLSFRSLKYSLSYTLFISSSGSHCPLFWLSYFFISSLIASSYSYSYSLTRSVSCFSGIPLQRCSLYTPFLPLALVEMIIHSDLLIISSLFHYL